ncbi:hypothetical protein SAMN04488029_2135 [Reichenbachiella faecimaris]|uniref:Uncharacterized protein n=1 Tax=Reichenbachiella faecimaris TaxID=692418 RepID=A0A1W2GDT3_REIFA|nr:alpha/beta hydrolase-fold protein [Reichenbachiella faecimaris]SMD34684.1 hypothetical protein SAMN04488029_2135 [Reichenbachiella faecimaris]
MLIKSLFQFFGVFLFIAGLANCQKQDKSSVANEKNTQIVIGHKDSVYSETLKESRNIWVHVPRSSNNELFESQKYPVLYILDGSAHFHSATGMINQLSPASNNSVMPETIVVAISNTNRSRDLTPTESFIDPHNGDSILYESGGGNDFLSFIEKELIPYVEKKYPVTSYKTFVGHSFGGLSVINALISRPHLFNNYVAIDPSLWWDKKFYDMADSTLRENNYEGKSLFIGVANTMPEGMSIENVKNDTTASTLHIRTILNFVNTLDANEKNKLDFGWKYYEDDSHGSVPFITAYDAFRFLFPWYNFNQSQLYDTSADPKTLIALMNDHYGTVSKKFGYEVLPPANLVNNIGYYMMSANNFKTAHAFFDLNIQNYPNMTNVYDSKGDCHLAETDTLLAIELFSKALQIGPNNYSQKKIDQLTKPSSQEF